MVLSEPQGIVLFRIPDLYVLSLADSSVPLRPLVSVMIRRLSMILFADLFISLVIDRLEESVVGQIRLEQERKEKRSKCSTRWFQVNDAQTRVGDYSSGIIARTVLLGRAKTIKTI